MYIRCPEDDKDCRETAYAVCCMTCQFVFMLLCLIGLIPIAIIVAMGVGELRYLCGPYGNKYIPAKCLIDEIGYLDIYGQVYNFETQAWETGVVSHNYEMRLQIVTSVAPQDEANITISFNNVHEYTSVRDKYSLENNSLKDCWILNRVLILLHADKLQFNWNPHKFTFGTKSPYCGYTHVIWGSILSGYVLVPVLFGLCGICCTAWCYGCNKRTRPSNTERVQKSSKMTGLTRERV